MAIIWFSDEDRQRMREEHERHAAYDQLFRDFVCEVQPYRVASREASPIDLDRMAMLQIRPWPTAE